MDAADPRLPTFRAPYAAPDDELAANLLAGAHRDSAAESRIDTRATKLVEAIRAKAGGLGGVEEFLHAYSLSTKEGLALMVLAEALLRVPDAATADRLIEDKLAAGRWRDGDVKSTALSGLGLGLDARRRRPRHSSRRDAGDHPRQHRAAARPAHGARGDAAGDAAPRLAFRARADHRRGAASRPRPRRIPLFVRHARRGRAHRGRRRQIFRRLCRRDRGDRRASRQRRAAAAARHLGETLGAASALRGDVARARAQRAGAAAHRARAAGA